MTNKKYAPCSHLKLVKIEDNQYKAYLTNHIINMLKNPNYIDYPQVGSVFASQEQFGCIETGKLTFSLTLPFEGKILKINDALQETIVDAIENGLDAFLCELQITSDDYEQELVDEIEYNEYIGL